MGQSVTELYGARTEGLGLDQLQQVIENLAKREAESRKRAPNELLRVVKNGEVVWMTAEEADELLKPSGEDEDRTRALVERALKGETKVLVLELRTMIAIAVSMLDEYKRQGSLVVNEADRIRPLLIQSERRVNTTYRELREIEGRVEDIARATPYSMNSKTKWDCCSICSEQARTKRLRRSPLNSHGCAANIFSSAEGWPPT